MFLIKYNFFFFKRPIDISKYDLIFAGAQKNSGIAGLTVVIGK